MRKAIGLLSICVICGLLLSAAPAYAAEEPSSAPAALSAGTVYSVSPAAPASDGTGAAVTVIDLALNGAREDWGVRYEGGSGYYYGAAIDGVTYGAVIDGAVSGYFGSSNGSIPLYDGQGAVSGIVWGGCHPTAIDCTVGFLLTGDVSRGFLVEDGATVSCREQVLLARSGSGRFTFNNARLHSDSGVLLQMEEDAGDLAVTYVNGAYTGDLINGSGSALAVTVGHGALLCGDTVRGSGEIAVTVQAGGIWVVDENASLTSLTVEEGGCVYAALSENGDGERTLLPADTILEPGTYEAQPLTEELPTGHGPALPAEPSPEPVEPDAPLTEELPIGHGPAIMPAEPSPEPEAVEPTAPFNRDDRLFPLSPDEPSVSPAPQEDGENIMTMAAGGEEPSLGGGVLSGLALARRTACGGGVQTSPASVGIMAQLAVRASVRPTAAALVKTGAKTHSFLPEALDKPSIILYNPYCCLAA